MFHPVSKLSNNAISVAKMACFARLQAIFRAFDPKKPLAPLFDTVAEKSYHTSYHIMHLYKLHPKVLFPHCENLFQNISRPSKNRYQ